MLWIGQLRTDISQVGLTNFWSRLGCALKSAHVQYVIAALCGRGVAGGASGYTTRIQIPLHGASAGCRFCTLDIPYYNNERRPLYACHPNMYNTRYAGPIYARHPNVVGVNLYVSTCRICAPTSCHVITVPPFLGEERSDLRRAFLLFGRIDGARTALRMLDGGETLYVGLSRLPAVGI